MNETVSAVLLIAAIFVPVFLIGYLIWHISTMNEMNKSLRNINKLVMHLTNMVHSQVNGLPQSPEYAIPHRQCPKCGYYSAAEEKQCSHCSYSFTEQDKVIR